MIAIKEDYRYSIALTFIVMVHHVAIEIDPVSGSKYSYIRTYGRPADAYLSSLSIDIRHRQSKIINYSYAEQPEYRM